MTRITVINDDTEYISLISDLLQREGYFADTLIIGETNVLDSLHEHHPDLIILDPSVRGTGFNWTYLQIVKLDPQMSLVPIILCTADWKQVAGQREVLRKMNISSLRKPFTVDELLAAVQTLFPGAPTAGPA